MPVPNAMGVHEIAARLGVSKTYTREIVARAGFPKGLRLNQGWIWDTRDVERWIAGHPEVGRKARGELGAG